MQISCPECNKKYDFEGLHIGQKVKCQCGNKFLIAEKDMISDIPGLDSEKAPSLPHHEDSKDSDHTLLVKTPDSVPPLIAKCKIIKKVGKGASGSVYLAEHTTLRIPVAVKILASHLIIKKDFVRRFYREARTTAKLEHPNIVRILDCGKEEDILYLLMEYMNGGNLKEYIQANGALRVAKAMRVIRDIANALMEAEKHNIIHRDIKPDNIMIGSGNRYKLADLGLARELADITGGAEITTASIGMGTPHYMPPEQALDARKVDCRADIYALGCTFYYLLAEEPPYPQKEVAVVLRHHINSPIPDIREKAPTVSQPVAAIIRKCMQKRPEDRYQHASILLRDLEIAMKIKTGILTAEQGYTPKIRSKTVHKLPHNKIRSTHKPTKQKSHFLKKIGMIFAIIFVLFFLAVTTKNKKKSQKQNSKTSKKLEQTQDRISKENLLPEQHAILLFEAGKIASQLPETKKLIDSFKQAMQITAKLPEIKRTKIFKKYEEQIEYIINSYLYEPEKLNQILKQLMPYTENCFGTNTTKIENSLLRRILKPLDLKAKIESLPGYKVSFTYDFSSSEQMSDFIQPFKDWIKHKKLWIPRRKHWIIDAGVLKSNVVYPTVLYWKIPHYKNFQIEYSATPSLLAKRIGDLNFVFGSSGVPSIGNIDNTIRCAVAGYNNSKNAVKYGEHKKIIASSPFTVFENDTIKARIECQYPRLSFYVDNNKVYSGNLENKLDISIPGFMGPQTWWQVNYLSMKIILPFSHILKTLTSPNIYIYPLCSSGTGRFEKQSWGLFYSLSQSLKTLDPQKKEMHSVARILSTPNGEYIEKTASNTAFIAY
ncbi:MAG: protein kinase, partial [Verrucomicrobiota bacterium]|nr:protein kinase [Verrucomicrobiota bacterium]